MHNSIRKASGLIVSALALGFVSTSALAEDREFSWSTTMTGTSDYIFRGLSLNNEDPAYQQSIDASYGIFYAGVWGSMVDGTGYEPVELDWYAGFKPEWGPVTFDFGVVYYTYFWGNPSNTNYVEFKAGASFEPVKNLTIKPVFWFTPDQDNYGETYTIEGTAAYALPAVGIFTPTVSGLIGYTEGEPADFFGPSDNYTYWNVGLALAVEKFIFDLRYWDTNLDSRPGDASYGKDDSRFVGTVSITLP